MNMHFRPQALISLILICIYTLTAGVGSAAAAEGDIVLLGARFIVGKGVLVTFKIGGDVDATQAASLSVNGITYDLTCHVNEEKSSTLLRCLAQLTRGSIGGEATIQFGTRSFQAVIKEPRPWCYSVFDFGAAGWGPIGTHCQVHTAGVGELIQFYNPEYAAVPFWIYRYDLDSRKACNGHSPDFGDGYYFVC
jgi:hypothetical protein